MQGMWNDVEEWILMPPFNPPAWTYSEGPLWPYYEYIYHTLYLWGWLPENQPFTYFMGQFAQGFPWAWILIGLVLMAFSAGLIYGMVKTRSFNPKYAMMLAPSAIGLVLWGHTIERIIHYAGVGVK
jgi:hypothetical protein